MKRQKPIIPYDTLDELNLASATRMARECGASMCRWREAPPRPRRPFAGLLYDLDHIDCMHRSEVVGSLLSGPSPVPVAVHGYNLEDEEIVAMHANGVVAVRAFDAEVVRALCMACAGRPRPSAPPGGDPNDPAALCAWVRELGSDCHRVLHRHPDGRNDSPAEIRGLRRRIILCQERVDEVRLGHDLTFADLARWLRALRRRVDDVPER